MTVSQLQATAVLSPEDAQQRLVDEYGFVPRDDWGRFDNLMVRDPSVTVQESQVVVSDRERGLDLDKPVYELTFTESNGRKSAIAVQELELVGLLVIAAPSSDVRSCPDLKAAVDAEVDKLSRGFVCGCGCGCNRRYHHATSSYCPACRNGCCGE